MRTIQVLELGDIFNLPEMFENDYREVALRYMVTKAELQRKLGDMIEIVDKVEMDALYWGEYDELQQEFEVLRSELHNLDMRLQEEGEVYRKRAGF